MGKIEVLPQRFDGAATGAKSLSLYSNITLDNVSNASDRELSSADFNHYRGRATGRGRRGEVNEARDRVDGSEQRRASIALGGATHWYEAPSTGKTPEPERDLRLFTDLCSVEFRAETKDCKHVTDGNV